MFNKKNRFSFFGFLFSLIIIFSLSSNVFAHRKFIDNNSSSTDTSKVVAQQNFDEIEIKTIPVRGNIYMLTGDGGNIGVSVGQDGSIMIDSQFAPLSAKIQDELQKISSKQPMRYLINTHYHFDHTGGNENFANTGAMIIAHDNVPKQMSIAHDYAVLGMKTEASKGDALPKITFSDSTKLALNDNYINAFHIPLAHTDGDVVVHFTKQNVIHAGDLFFNGFYPFIDTEVGGSIDGMIAAIDRILPLCNEETLIIPGHGNLSNKQELIAFQNMLKTVSNRVKVGIAENMSLQEMIEAQTLEDLDENWGKGFLSSEQFLTIAYQGIINKR
jgi:glyoxylase-like metal-dependent hydrolase (beta-lactamase superfamily II)